MKDIYHNAVKVSMRNLWQEMVQSIEVISNDDIPSDIKKVRQILICKSC